MVSLQFFRDDWRNNFLRTITKASGEILTEKGRTYTATHRNSSFTDGDTTSYAIRTASDEPTIVNFDLNVEGKVQVDLYEDATVSNGSSVFDENRNRANFADAASDVEPLAQVTVDSQGTKIATGGAGGAVVTGADQSIPATVIGTPWILKSDTTYVYTVENLSGTTVDLNATLGYSTRDLP